MSRRTVVSLVSVALGLALGSAVLSGCASPPDTQVMLLEPSDGATVTSPFKVRFGVKGLTVAPAGNMAAGSGHHHLLINLDAVPAGQSVPFTEQHLHFGKGQTDAEVTLPPGRYKLTAQFANGAHQSYGSPLSHSIQVTVR